MCHRRNNCSIDDYRNRDKKVQAWKGISVELTTAKQIKISKDGLSGVLQIRMAKYRKIYTRKKRELKGKTGQVRKKIENNDVFLALQF